MTVDNLQRDQLREQQRRVDFDTYDVTVDELLRRVGTQRVEIAPIYQRHFRWEPWRQSRLVESILLGIPIPPLFMATNTFPGAKTQWEVVDGLQRLLTLVNFAGDSDTRQSAELRGAPLKLERLEKLSALEGLGYGDLPEDIKTGLLDRPLKVIVLNDKSEARVRFDLFERLNTGGVALTAQEIRECVFKGPFIELLGELSSTTEFRAIVHLPLSRLEDGTPQDFVLRYFAFSECYLEFQHSVQGFLNDFAAKAVESPEIARRRRSFLSTFSFLAACLPDGLRGWKDETPVNLFEAVSVGAFLALGAEPSIAPPVDLTWLGSPDLRRLVTGGTNSRSRVRGRIELCRDRFLGR